MKVNIILKSILILHAIGMLSGCGSQPAEDATPGTGVIHMSAVYKRYLEHPFPTDGWPVRTNPPILRWPAHRKPDVHYDVRLSTLPDFSDKSKTLEVSKTPMSVYNPHKKLEHGTWFWQYKIAGGEWSDTMSFVMDESSVVMESPPPRVFLNALPESHPRVLATRDEIETLRAISDEDRRAIIHEAEKALSEKIAVEKDGYPVQSSDDEEQNRKFKQDASQRLGDRVYHMVVPLCEAYILSGDEKYAKKAITAVMEVAGWKPRGVSGISDFGDARCMLAMALAYDTFFERFTEDQKQTLIQAISLRTTHFYESWVNNIEARVLSGHVWQHILHYFFQTALALHGDLPEADDWLTYAYELFLARAPILGGLDGGWMEGVSYFRMNMETMIDIPLFIKKFTGFDFFKVHPWYMHQADWMIYHIPPGSAPDGFSDNTEEMSTPGSEYIAFAKELAKLTGNARAAWYADECMKYEQVNHSEKRTLRWIRLARTRDLVMPEHATPPDLPMGRVFKDIGVAAMHTMPQDTPDNLVVAMRSSPYGSYGHLLSDQNVFNILYGGKKIFYRTGYKVTMKDPHRTGWYQHTKSQNGILVDDEGQPYSTEAFGWIARYLEGGGLAYVKGDASNAYKSEETGENYGVIKNHRHIMLLQPDIIVIYDELEANKDVRWSWLIHSLEKMTINPEDQTFSVSVEGTNGAGRLWSLQPIELTLSDTFDVAAVNWRGSLTKDGELKTYDSDQWHLKASNTNKAAAMRYFTVIRVGIEANETDLLSDEMTEGSVQISSGDWKIIAHLDDSISPGVYIQNQKSGTVFSTHRPSIQTGNKTFKGDFAASAKLGIINQGKPVFFEAADELPYDMRYNLKFYNQSNY